MSTLPNILPASGADSSNGGAKEFSKNPGKVGKSFDQLMAHAMSPIPARENAVSEISPQQTKSSKHSAQTSGKVRAKTSGDNPDGGANSSVPVEVNFLAVNSENISIQTVAPVAATTDLENELSAEMAVTAGPGEIAAVLPGVKNISWAAGESSIAANSQNQNAVEASPVAKTEVDGKIAAAVEALATGKINPANSKAAGLASGNPQIPPLFKEDSGDLPVAKPALEMFAQPTQDGFSRSPDLTAKSAAQQQADLNGTPAAQQDVPMKNAGKIEKTDGPAGKVLPGDAVFVSRENNLPMPANSSATDFSRAGQMTATVAANSAPPGHTIDVALPSGDSAAAAMSNDFRARTLERAQDMIVMHSKSMGDSGNDLLQVVIKPGAGTQLSLELRQRGDGVEAQAVLQRGDFEHLNRQWPELQQQLEQRGIRLAPLGSDGNFSGSDGSQTFHKQQNNSTEPDSFPAGAFAEVAPAGLPPAKAANAKSHRGWETWA